MRERTFLRRRVRSLSSALRVDHDTVQAITKWCTTFPLCCLWGEGEVWLIGEENKSVGCDSRRAHTLCVYLVCESLCVCVCVFVLVGVCVWPRESERNLINTLRCGLPSASLL